MIKSEFHTCIYRHVHTITFQKDLDKNILKQVHVFSCINFFFVPMELFEHSAL